LCVYFSAVALLDVAFRIRNGVDKLMDILPTLLRHDFNQSCSDLSLRITEFDTPELVKFLQKSAVERLTTYRQLMARDFGSVVTIVTTDFEALYAYRRGDYWEIVGISKSTLDPLRSNQCNYWLGVVHLTCGNK